MCFLTSASAPGAAAAAWAGLGGQLLGHHLGGLALELVQLLQALVAGAFCLTLPSLKEEYIPGAKERTCETFHWVG